MWTVFEARSLEKTLARLPDEVLKRYEKWKDIVMLAGLQGLRDIKGFHDEQLKGQWTGYRSSRLGYQYRIIYQAESDRFMVFVIDVTAHDYRRR
jgi:addiction module RelE/StbE family toxin